MRKNNYLFFLIAGAFSLAFFFYPLNISLKIDDFSAQTFYALNKKNISAQEIVIVEIDNASLEKIGQQWPFKRSIYAKALNIFKEEKAKVVSFDIAFVGNSSSEEDDKLFEEAIEQFDGKVVLAYFLDKKGLPIYPKKEFKEKTLNGFINVPADGDKIIRRARNYYKRGDFSDFSWTIKTAGAFYDFFPLKGPDFILLKGRQIPLMVNGTTNVNFLFKPRDFSTISFSDLISHNFPSGFFSRKIVLISPTLEIAHDIHATPLGYMAGTFIQANALVNVLKEKFLMPLPFYFNLIILILTLVFISYVISSWTFLRRIFLTLGFFLFLFWLSIAFKLFGFQFFYGKIMFSALSFLIVGNLYAYGSFLMNILKIKNRMVIDPITNFYTLRYFFERLNLESRHISVRKKYLLVIKLAHFKFLFKKKSFEEMKYSWSAISSFLFSISNLWSQYSQEVIVGRIYNSENAEQIKKRLETIAFEKGLKTSIKIAWVKVFPSINTRDIAPFMIQKLDESTQDVIFFQKDDFVSSLKKERGNEDFLSSLDTDAEEKNKELLMIIEKLKNEEKNNQDAYLQLISSLVVALESKDPYTEGHTKRVCRYSLLLADELNIGGEEREKIQKGALLHDLGKIGIPDAILHKKGALTDEEFTMIKEHEIISAKILEPIQEFHGIIPYVIQHHESFDGSGYPHGLAGEFISLGARIIAVADVFDALTTGRDYKKAFSVKDSVAELEKMKGKKLDSVLVDKFIDALKRTKIYII
ncbi:MAG: HD domain-containing phosphohydrolase [Candidatus Omnitrophota bacterium]